MKTWSDFLVDVEFLSAAMIVTTYSARNYTEEHYPESKNNDFILYEAQGADETWIPQFGSLDGRDGKWLIQFGLFPFKAEYLQYHVVWIQGECKLSFDKGTTKRFGRDIITLCK